jgi:hypothetical protein
MIAFGLLLVKVVPGTVVCPNAIKLVGKPETL